MKPNKYQSNIKRLNNLLVLRSISKSDIHNEEIKQLQSEIDFFEYGIKIK